MTKRNTLLIVDDERELVDNLARRLRLKGYDVLTAYSGDDAIKLLEKADVEVVITDLRMPGEISGRELYVHIRSMGLGAPRVVLMSGYHEELDSVEMTNQELTSPLPIKINKPFQVQELLDLIA